ncbi:hypothetical protein C0J52_28032 [Blattella germanica]|nr:hypothetical protein C0J52_28032 [Blattella germanica]
MGSGLDLGFLFLSSQAVGRLFLSCILFYNYCLLQQLHIKFHDSKTGRKQIKILY